MSQKKSKFIWLQPIVNYLVYIVVRLFVCAIQATRVETGQRVANQLAWFFGEVLKVRHKVVIDNLRHAFPELPEREHRRIMKQMWQHLFLLILEVAHAPRKIHETNWRRYVSLKNDDMLVQQLLEDRPVMIVTAHFGNFEVSGYLLGLLGFPTYTIARTLDNPHIDRFLGSFRGKTGQYIISKNGGYDEILQVLASGGTMTLLADQYAGTKGCWVEFFGRPASAHKAIALLSLDNDATIVTAAGTRRDKPLHFELNVTATADPRDTSGDLGTIKTLTQWYTTRLEEMIRDKPGQYWWLHRRWKDRRKKRKAKRKEAA
ncbi:MAG: lysophospholipid acyltransferase family protein [Planctomycetia bacterium]